MQLNMVCNTVRVPESQWHTHKILNKFLGVMSAILFQNHINKAVTNSDTFVWMLYSSVAVSFSVLFSLLSAC